MTTFEKFPRSKSKGENSVIKTTFYVILTVSVTKARITGTSSISKHLIGEDISSFCVHEKCAVVFPNGTSVSLPLAEFYTLVKEYLNRKDNTDDNSNFKSDISHAGVQSNMEKSIEKDERIEFDVTEANTDIYTGSLETPPTISSASIQLFKRGMITLQSDLSISTISPASKTNATKQTPTTICEICNEINAFRDSNNTEIVINTTTSFSSEKEHTIYSGSISDFSPKHLHNDIDIIPLSTNYSGSTRVYESKENDESETTTPGCKVQQPKRISDEHLFVDQSIDESGDSTITSYPSSTKPPTTKLAAPKMDYDYNDEEFQFQDQKPTIQLTEGRFHPIFSEEIEEAKKMTECAKKKTNNGVVCVCNGTYCDKFIPPDETPEWMYTWYTSSKGGLRFRKKRNNLTPYKGDEEGAIYVNTSRKYQKIFGFGGSFTDSACKLIKDLSKEVKKNLLGSYFGPFGIHYKFGRVPIGGTDFSPRFYTYMDTMADESMTSFMLTEQDFKYKIPIISEAIEMTQSQLKLIGSAWSPPTWMKMVPDQFFGTLKREYFSLWANYHIKFLDQYLRNGVKFWAISTGNEPMNSYHVLQRPHINAMEWTPQEQSHWVDSHLYPMLKNSSHRDVLLLGLDGNRENAPLFMKYFSNDYQLKSFENPKYIHESKVMGAISGIAIHGYMDYKSNLPNLQTLKDMFPNKFLIYTESSCCRWTIGHVRFENKLVGKPELGSWTCGEEYATRIITVSGAYQHGALNHWAAGWIDWNLALDMEGGPTYVENFLHSAILVDVKRDEFFKESMFYIMGHLSIFLLPNSYRVETKTPGELEKIHAVAAVRPDDGKVIVFYNKYDKEKRITFLIDQKYKLSIKVPGKSMNSVLFW